MGEVIRTARPHATDSAPAATPLLQRACACGQHSGGGECAECKKQRETGLQRATVSAGPQTAPPIVHEVLRGSGQPLDAQTRAFMEPRFGHDFSRVRVHTDARAAESARAVNALAYTVGQQIAFGAGQYAPGTPAGLRLLAHELTHAAQQGPGNPVSGAPLRVGSPTTAFEREAKQASRAIVQGHGFTPQLQQPAQLARDLPIPDELDPEQRQQAEDLLRERALRRQGRVEPPPGPGRATFSGGRLNVIKGGRSYECQALTSSTAPTPPGSYCVRKQGQAQRWGGFMGTLGRIGGLFTTFRQDRSSWYLLEPQFATTRSKMQIHYGMRSEGCITVTKAECFNRLEAILNLPGTTTRKGYDGYPPGNAEGVKNEEHDVDCVAILEVS